MQELPSYASVRYEMGEGQTEQKGIGREVVRRVKIGLSSGAK